MAKKPNISEVKTTRELFSLMPPENAGLLIAEMHTQAKQAVLREIAATHQTVKLPVDQIVPFDDNPYQVLDNEEMDELVQSIKERGILSPLIVLPKPDDAHTFELISGHRRLFAAKKAGLKKVPAVVCNVSRDEAAIMVVDSNLHREHILPSEKAKAYKLRLDAMKQQGKRVDLTSSQVGTKLRADEELAEIAGESRNQIHRYIRLNNLVPELQSLVDENRIALTPAVELSYLTEDEQKNLLETIESEDCTPSLAQAQQMRKLSEQGKLDMDAIFGVMTKPKANQKEMVRLPMESISRFLPKNATPKDAAQFIEKACEHYRRYLNRQRDMDAR
jgi:ParB family chromosome partitioning protein